MADVTPDPVLDARDEGQVAAQAVGALPAELSDRGDSNPAVVILEACAWIYGKLTYQLSQWPRAVLQKLLALVGITLSPAAAATTTQQFTIATPKARDTTYPAGTLVALADGTIVFETTEDATIAAYSAPVGSIAFTAGSTAVVGTATAFPTGTTWVGWKIGIQGPSGAAPSIWYTIASVTNANLLVITTNATATASGTFFSGPVTTTAAARATTTGTATNVGAGTLTSLQSGSGTTTNLTDAVGGADLQTADEAVANAPVSLCVRDVAVTEEDYAEFARRILGTGGRAKAMAGYNGAVPASGYVSVALLSPTWTAATPVTASERAAVVRDLAGRTMGGSTTVDVAASIVTRTPAAAIYRKAAYSDATAQVNVAGAINTWLSPNTYAHGRTIYPSDLVQAVENAAGVDRVHSIRGVSAVSSAYQAATPAALALVNGSATALTANTASFTAGRTFIVDDVAGAVYLVISIAAGASVTFDRVFAGASLTAVKPYFTCDDDAMGGLWYDLPYSALSTDTASLPASIVIVGSV